MTKKRPKLFIFGEIDADAVLGEIMKRKQTVFTIPYTYVENSKRRKDSRSLEQREKEEALHEVISTGASVVFLSEYAGTTEYWLKRFLSKPMLCEKKHVVVVSGATKAVWKPILGELEKHKVELKEVQWFVTMNLWEKEDDGLGTRVQVDEKETEIDLAEELKPIIAYVEYLAQVHPEGLGELSLLIE